MEEFRPEGRRSTRVPLKISIEVRGRGYGFRCVGETVVVNAHGALIKTHAALRPDEAITVYVHFSRRRASAHVVYISSEDPSLCAIELEKADNIWGVTLPPTDWGG